jgi:phage shock protein A
VPYRKHKPTSDQLREEIERLVRHVEELKVRLREAQLEIERWQRAAEEALHPRQPKRA